MIWTCPGTQSMSDLRNIQKYGYIYPIFNFGAPGVYFASHSDSVIAPYDLRYTYMDISQNNAHQEGIAVSLEKTREDKYKPSLQFHGGKTLRGVVDQKSPREGSTGPKVLQRPDQKLRRTPIAQVDNHIRITGKCSYSISNHAQLTILGHLYVRSTPQRHLRDLQGRDSIQIQNQVEQAESLVCNHHDYPNRNSYLITFNCPQHHRDLINASMASEDIEQYDGDRVDKRTLGVRGLRSQYLASIR